MYLSVLTLLLIPLQYFIIPLYIFTYFSFVDNFELYTSRIFSYSGKHFIIQIAVQIVHVLHAIQLLFYHYIQPFRKSFNPTTTFYYVKIH